MTPPHLFHNYQESPETLTKQAFAVAKSVLFCFFLWLSSAFCVWCHPIKKWCCKEGICVRTAQPEMEVIIFVTHADSIRDTAHIWGLSQTVMSLPTRGNCTSWMGSKRPLMLIVSAGTEQETQFKSACVKLEFKRWKCDESLFFHSDIVLRFEFISAGAMNLRCWRPLSFHNGADWRSLHCFFKATSTCHEVEILKYYVISWTWQRILYSMPWIIKNVLKAFKQILNEVPGVC